MASHHRSDNTAPTREEKRGREEKRSRSGEAAAEQLWQALLELSRNRRARLAVLPRAVALGAATVEIEGGAWTASAPLAPPLAAFLDLYLPVAAAPAGFVVGHLGQSLDGRIATRGGASQWLTGAEDVRHNHRMRALADAVLVGAGTLRCDDPQLTVRDCEGSHPVRVVLDSRRTLDDGYRVFHDGAAPTLVIAGADRAAPGERLGGAEILPLPRGASGIAPAAIRDALARRGLRRLYVEGGGVTVSRFLAAHCLDRLQIAVSPVILGSGRPGIALPEITDLGAALRPRTRRFELGADILFDCVLGG